jgi:hypothetical protein
MQRLKASGRAEDTEILDAVGGLVPAPLRSPVVKALASPSLFNLTISQSPVMWPRSRKSPAFRPGGGVGVEHPGTDASAGRTVSAGHGSRPKPLSDGEA